MADETLAALDGRLDEFVMMVGTAGRVLGQRRGVQGARAGRALHRRRAGRPAAR